MKRADKLKQVSFSLIAFGAVTVCFASLTTASAQNAKYRTELVAKEPFGNATSVSGSVVPYKEVVLAAQIPGQIKTLKKRVGDKVKAGDLLVSINDDQIQAQRRAAMAVMYAAQAELRNAHVQYSREIWSPRSGKPTGMGMPSMMDSFMRPFSGQYAGPNDPWVRRYADLHGQARNLDSARSRLLQARAQIERLDARLRDAHVRAPFAGVITNKYVEEGATVQPGQQLVRIAFIEFLQIRAEIPVGMLGGVKVKDEFPVTIDTGGGLRVMARVDQVYPMADRTRHTVTVKFSLREGVPAKPGMYAEISIPDSRAKANMVPTIPKEAIIYRGSLPAVEIEVNGAKFMRLVRLGEKTPSGKLTVLSGLKGGETIILPLKGSSPTQQAGTSSTQKR